MTQKGIIFDEETRKCELCGKVAECRPYGPNGEDVCFKCGMKDEEAAKRQFSKSLHGTIEYACGCVVKSEDCPQDQDWRSEVICPDCAEYQDSVYQEAMSEKDANDDE
jgi:hypothetical protein